MIGIVIVSHGALAEGMLDTCRLFFPDGLPQVKALGLMQEDSAEEFERRIEEAVQEADTGEGVLVMCDLLGGTPANCSRRIMLRQNREEIQFVAGFNLAMLLEALGSRFSAEHIREIDISELLLAGNQGIVSLNQQMAQKNTEEEDFFD